MGPRQGRRRELDVAWLVECEREEGGRVRKERKERKEGSRMRKEEERNI